jgi:GT2 family glycosyltransferase
LIYLTYPHAHTVKHNFAYSLAQFINYTAYHIDIQPERCYPGDDLAAGRNRSAQRFLETKKPKHEWYWTLDTDMGFKPNILAQLFATCGKIVTGHYRIQIEKGQDEMGGPQYTMDYPVAMKKAGDGGYRPYDADIYAAHSIMRVDATGAGCLLIHRDVMEAIGQDWFTCKDGYGEDFSFCHRAKQHGYNIYLNTEARLTHCKETWI